MGVWSQVGCGLPLTRVQLAWAVFDAGSFGFYSVTYNTYVPIWFAQEAGQQGISPHMATAKWGYSVACAMLISSVAAPLLGWAADVFRQRKPLLFLMLSFSMLSLNTALIAGTWRAKLTLLTLGYAAYALSSPLYNAFLPLIVAGDGKGGRGGARGGGANGKGGGGDAAARGLRGGTAAEEDNDGGFDDEVNGLLGGAGAGRRASANGGDETSPLRGSGGGGGGRTPSPSSPKSLAHSLSLMSTWIGNLGAGTLMLLVVVLCPQEEHPVVAAARARAGAAGKVALRRLGGAASQSHALAAAALARAAGAPTAATAAPAAASAASAATAAAAASDDPRAHMSMWFLQVAFVCASLWCFVFAMPFIFLVSEPPSQQRPQQQKEEKGPAADAAVATDKVATSPKSSSAPAAAEAGAEGGGAARKRGPPAAARAGAADPDPFSGAAGSGGASAAAAAAAASRGAAGGGSGGGGGSFCRRYRDLVFFLLASFFINEASSIVYQMNAIFALNAAHIDRATIVHATIMNRFVAVGSCFAWAAALEGGKAAAAAANAEARAAATMADEWGDDVDGAQAARRGWGGLARRVWLAACACFGSPLGCFSVAVGFTVIAGLLCLFMHHPWQYWALQVVLGFAGSGTFAFARSILSSMTPAGKSAQVNHEQRARACASPACARAHTPPPPTRRAAARRSSASSRRSVVPRARSAPSSSACACRSPETSTRALSWWWGSLRSGSCCCTRWTSCVGKRACPTRRAKEGARRWWGRRQRGRGRR